MYSGVSTGSIPARPRRLSPEAVISVQGDISSSAPGRPRPASRSFRQSTRARFPPAESPARTISPGAMPRLSRWPQAVRASSTAAG